MEYGNISWVLVLVFRMQIGFMQHKQIYLFMITQCIVEAPGIDPGTSGMLSERSTIWATPPFKQLNAFIS